MQEIFYLSNGPVAGATYQAQVSPSLLNQTTKYGFTGKEPSVADSRASSRTVQVTVMRAKLDAEKKLAELEEEQAREKRQRAEKVLKAEMELKIAEAALAEELGGDPRAGQWIQNVQEADPVDRVQQWIQDLQAQSSTTKPSSARNRQQQQEQAESIVTQTSHDRRRTQGSSGVNTEMLQITKSMQKMLARTTGGESLPNFDGNVKEWPLFINQYRLSTAAGEYSGIENVVRFNKCLTGKAREAVQHMLMASTDAEEIVKALELRFGNCC